MPDFSSQPKTQAPLSNRRSKAAGMEWRMAKKSFPCPQDVSFILLEKGGKKAVSIDAIPQQQWYALRSEILKQISKSICSQYLSEEIKKGK